MRATRVAAIIARRCRRHGRTKPVPPRRRSTMSRPRSACARSTARGNNVAHPDWGQVGRPYLRVAPAAYADGVGTPVAGPPTRYVSNRVFADCAQNLFSENGGHAVGLRVGAVHGPHDRAARGGRRRARADRASTPHDPLEAFRNDFGAIDFSRTPAAPGTGTGGVVREQINTVSSYIDGWSVYGGTDQPARVAARGPGQRQPRRQRRAAAAGPRRAAAAPLEPRRRRHGARDGLPGRPRRDAAEGDGRR